MRELENMVHRLAALYPQEQISRELVEIELNTARPGRPETSIEMTGTEAQVQAAITAFARRLLEDHSDETPVTDLYHKVLREVEEPLVSATLRAVKGNQIKASSVLGLNRNTLRKKIRELDIEVLRGFQ